MEIKELWHTSDSDTILKKKIFNEHLNRLTVKSLFSLISPGTEKIVAKGMVPIELYHQMKVPYMKGNFTFPISYGYSLVGQIVRGPEEIFNKYVHVMHPHHNYAFVRQEDLFLIPEGVSLKRASLASSLETIVNAIWDSKVSLGDNIVIVGFGIIGGLLAATLMLYPGLSVSFFESNNYRIKLAEKLKLKSVTTGSKELNQYDIAFNCSGNEKGLQYCIDHIRPEGKVIELSWYGNQKININLGSSFHRDRKSILSSQVSSIPTYKSLVWDFRKRKHLVFDLLKNKIYDNLLNLEIPFENTPKFFKKLRNNTVNEPGIIISY